MVIAWIVSALALAFGAGLGARAMLDPHWAQRLVRLKPDEQGGGEAEFRATYGGLFAFAHGVALIMVLRYLFSGEHVVGVAATGAVAVLSAGWAGAAAGRIIAMARDNADTEFNRKSVAVEAAAAVAIALPWLLWMLGV